MRQNRLTNFHFPSLMAAFCLAALFISGAGLFSEARASVQASSEARPEKSGGSQSGATEFVYLPLILNKFCGEGNPAIALRTSQPGTDFGQYNSIDFDVFQQDIHCRTVTVAIGKDFGTNTYNDRLVLKNFIFDTWKNLWEEFGGFPFKSYTIVIGNNLPYDADVKGYGEFGEGFETSYDPRLQNYQYYSHGMYHAWNGSAFRQYMEGRWFMEGVTEYYGFRFSLNTFYTQGLQYAYQKYIAVVQAGRDVALCTINGSNPDWLHYWKGALVAYMLDKDLSFTGHHLGQAARLVYQRYGVDSQGIPTDAQFLSILQEVSGKDYTDFYNRYICGTEPLPLDGVHFDWIDH